MNRRPAVAETARVWIRDHPVGTLIVLGLIARVTAMAISNIYFAGEFAGDTQTYSFIARSMASGDLSLWTSQEYVLRRITFTFVGPLSLLYRIFGPHEWIGQLMVIAQGVGVVAVVGALATRFMTRVGVVVAVTVVALLPSQVLWSSLLLKDAAVWLVISAIALLTAIATQEEGRRLVVVGLGIGVLLLALGHLREHTLVVAVLALIPAALISEGARWVRAAGAVMLAFLVPLIVGIGPVGWSLVTDGPALEARRQANAEGARSAFVETHQPETARAIALQEHAKVLVSEIEQLRETAAQVRQEETARRETVRELNALESAIAEKKAVLRETNARLETVSAPSDEDDSSTLNPSLRHFPRGLLTMLVAPVPWQAGTSTQMDLARFEMVLWYPILLFAAVGIPTAVRRREMAFPLLIGAGVLTVYALTEGNIGTAFRHRGEFVWVVALLAGIGIEQIALRRRSAEHAKPQGAAPFVSISIEEQEAVADQRH